ncbi:hypothetical protein L227DRAFT_514565, partial [Lentinus tigrinus ALCF2SS1-6]
LNAPFHSYYLCAGVISFCAYLSKKINPAHLILETFAGQYAKPFEVIEEYAQVIYDQTLPPRLDKWDQENWDSAEQRRKLAYVILVELLAYQFASPVRLIEA